MRPVRASVILSWLVLTLGSAGVSGFADVIHLKNGRMIVADSVREHGNHIEYDIGENSYAIPKASVDHIEAGGTPAVSAATGASRDLPEFAPSDPLKNQVALADKIIREDRVDVDALSALEKAGDAEATAAGYFVAGKHEFDHSNLPSARGYFETALRFDPDNPTILNYYCALLVRTGNATAALPYAEQSVRSAPESPDTLTVLGYVQFATGHTKDAIRSWKHALQLRPDATVQKYLEKAEHEATAEEDFSERESSHFTLRFEGQQTAEPFHKQLLAALEADYEDLARSFDLAPRNSISVSLYTDQAFFDVTQAPSWTGAVNDGKLRIPVHGLDSVTPELARVLKHELTHSFINELSAGRCPAWLNEGLAQAMEPRQVTNGRVLADLFKNQQEVPLNRLEGSFMGLSAPQAALAYGESLAAVRYLVDTYGMGELQQVLQKLGQGSSTEAALRSTIHSDYGELEAELGKYLLAKYGS